MNLYDACTSGIKIYLATMLNSRGASAAIIHYLRNSIGLAIFHPTAARGQAYIRTSFVERERAYATKGGEST